MENLIPKTRKENKAAILNLKMYGIEKREELIAEYENVLMSKLEAPNEYCPKHFVNCVLDLLYEDLEVNWESFIYNETFLNNMFKKSIKRKYEKRVMVPVIDMLRTKFYAKYIKNNY